jgi:hypothetical protein
MAQVAIPNGICGDALFAADPAIGLATVVVLPTV